MYNYPHGFIENCYGENNTSVLLKAKFLSAIVAHGSSGVMPAFLAELDAENKKQLFGWIICNYGNI